MKHSSNCRAFSLLELTVVMAVLGILLAAGLYGFNRYIENANGSACTRQLADISRAVSTVVTVYSIADDAGLAAIGPDDLAPYLGDKLVNASGSGGMSCPGRGTYALPQRFVTDSGGALTTQPEDVTCSIATSQAAKFKGTRLHSLQPIP